MTGGDEILKANINAFDRYYEKAAWWFRLRYDTQMKCKTALALANRLRSDWSNARIFELGFGSADLLFSFPRSCELFGSEISGSAIPGFIRRAIEYPDNGAFTIWGTGEETRSYCYIDDVVNGLLLAAEKLDVHQLLGPLNLGREGRVKMGELADASFGFRGEDRDRSRHVKANLDLGSGGKLCKGESAFGQLGASDLAR